MTSHFDRNGQFVTTDDNEIRTKIAQGYLVEYQMPSIDTVAITSEARKVLGPMIDKISDTDRPLSEPILPDDYPIYAGYCYVADGRVIVSDWHGITARQFKGREGITELRRCDMAGRGML